MNTRDYPRGRYWAVCVLSLVTLVAASTVLWSKMNKPADDPTGQESSEITPAVSPWAKESAPSTPASAAETTSPPSSDDHAPASTTQSAPIPRTFMDPEVDKGEPSSQQPEKAEKKSNGTSATMPVAPGPVVEEPADKTLPIPTKLHNVGTLGDEKSASSTQAAVPAKPMPVAKKTVIKKAVAPNKEKPKAVAAAIRTGPNVVKPSKPFKAPKTYSVWIYQERGDCLWRIAERVYHDRHKWRLIYQANRDVVHNPNQIFPNQRLRIPAQDWKP